MSRHQGMRTGYCLFDTVIGRCAIGWRDEAIWMTQLPESDDSALVRRLQAIEPEAAEESPPSWVTDIIARLRRHFEGVLQDFTDVPIHLERFPPFTRRVYEAARTISAGRTVTYGELARLAGSRDAARAVGQALARNPFIIIVPCHRVLAAGGKMGGFSAMGGTTTKEKLLAIEGVKSIC